MKKNPCRMQYPVFLLGSTDSKITFQKLHALLFKSRLAGGPPPLPHARPGPRPLCLPGWAALGSALASGPGRALVHSCLGLVSR